MVLKCASGSIVHRTADASASGYSLWGSSAQLVHAMRQAYTTSPKGIGSARGVEPLPSHASHATFTGIPEYVLKTQFVQ